MPSDSGEDNIPPSAIDNPASDSSEMLSQILATINANAAMMRSFDLKIDKIEKELTNLKSAGTATAGKAPAATVIPAADGLDTPKPFAPVVSAPAPPAARFTTPTIAPTAPATAHQEPLGPVQILRPGPAPATATRPGQTPMTPRVRGVSGFYVPVTPKKPPTSALVGIGISGVATAPSAHAEHAHLDPTRPALERIAASRRASDETSPEVKELRSQLWATCLAIIEAEFPGAAPEKTIAETEKLCSTHWLEIRKSRIIRSFELGHRLDGKIGKGDALSSDGWKRKISQSAATRVTPLTHENFYDWVSHIYSLLAPIPYATEILEGIEHGQDYDPAEPLRTTENYDAMLDLEIGGLIGGTVSQECRGYIFSRQSTGEFRGSVIWRDLNQIMQRNDGLGKATVLEHVLAERQKAGEGVRSYAERMRTLFIKSAAMGAPFSQSDQILYFLRGLQRYLDTARATIRGFQSQGTDYSFDKALGFLITTEAAIAHDQHSGRLPMLSRPTANIASSNGQEPRRLFVVRNTAQRGTPGYFNGACRHCQKWGHKEVDCAMRKREVDNETASADPARARVAQSSDDDQGGHEAQVSSQAEDEGDVFECVDENGDVFFARLATSHIEQVDGAANLASAYVASASHAATAPPTDQLDEGQCMLAAAHIPEKAVKWILDSGATHHMTMMPELLPVRLETGSDAVVHIADGTKAKITRRGACIATLFGDGGSEASAHLKTVLVVPSFTNNLLSVQRLAEEGWTIQFTKAGAELHNAKGQKVQTFIEPGTGAPYVMVKPQPVRYIDVKGSSKRSGPAKASARIAAVPQTKTKWDELVEVWHRRLAHMGMSTLRRLAKDPAFINADRPSAKHVGEYILKDLACDPCIEARQSLLPFDDSETKPDGRLSDVHFDLAGPFEGSREYKYSLQIIDAWSRMMWTYPLPNKEAATVFTVFEGWAELMRNQGHGTIKRLHCDHGGEFENHLFEAWSLKHGIAWNWAAPNTSEQNGLVERYNRTIQDRARAMLRAARLSDAFWPYAFRTACDVINKSPSVALEGHIPLTVWSDAPIDYDELRVFGCLAWVVKPIKTRKNKLTARAVRGTYLGTAPDHKAHLVYTPAERPFLRTSRHVIFDESRIYDARFALNEKQEHVGSEGDVLELVAPRRTVRLSDVPIEIDHAPHGEPVLDWDEDDLEEHDEPAQALVQREQQRGEHEGDWPTLDGLFGADKYLDDVFVGNWTEDLNRVRSPADMPPSVRGIQNAFTPALDDLGSPIKLDDLDAAWDNTPTRAPPPAARSNTTPTSAPAEPTKATAPTPVFPRRSARLQGRDQFKALTAYVQLAFQTSSGEALIAQARAFAAQTFAAAVRSSADGVLIEPRSLPEAKAREDWPKWEEGMKAEIDSLRSMRTWELTDLPPGRKTIGSKWAYKLKLDADGKATRWKARLVAQGFSQRAGLDYNETFAPVARLATVRIIVALAIRYGLIIWSMDVITAYLNGWITEDIFMRQPPHFDDGTGRVCKLNRSLYGLKQSGREWFTVIVAWLVEQGFKALQCEPCVFIKSSGGTLIIIVLYVDDVLIAAREQLDIDAIRTAFTQRFKMTDNGKLSQVLGLKININHNSGSATISQEAYIDGMIRRFGLEDANPVSTPMTMALQGLGPRTEGQATAHEIGEYASIVGCLMWAAQGTRPDIAYATSRLGRFMANPRPEHMVGAKRVLRYLRGTRSIGLVFTSAHSAQIEGFCDADHAKDAATRRSMSGYAFFIHGNLVSWRSRLQATVAISSTESEYMAMSEAAREAKWLRTFTTEVGFAPRRATDIFTDSSGAYSLARNPEGHNKLKHIDTHHHYVRELVATQQVSVTQIGTDDNAADIFTKVTGIARLQEGMMQLGLGDNTSADA